MIFTWLRLKYFKFKDERKPKPKIKLFFIKFSYDYKSRKIIPCSGSFTFCNKCDTKVVESLSSSWSINVGESAFAPSPSSSCAKFEFKPGGLFCALLKQSTPIRDIFSTTRLFTHQQLLLLSLEPGDINCVFGVSGGLSDGDSAHQIGSGLTRNGRGVSSEPMGIYGARNTNSSSSSSSLFESELGLHKDGRLSLSGL
jgi:hypothetical protein